MAFLGRLFKPKEPLEKGPLYPAVKDAMAEVQAYARSHGGRIELVAVTEEGDVKVRLGGSCRDCPLSTVTIRLGVTQRLKLLVPGVRDVIELN